MERTTHIANKICKIHLTLTLLEKNTHPKLVSELVGHSSTKVTMDRYAHLINPMNSTVVDTLEGIADL